jgi:hypothetical protein
MRIVFVVFALLVATLLAKTCSDGSAPEKRTGLDVCHGYEAVEACCTADWISKAKEEAKKKKSCGVSPTDSDFSKNAPFFCLESCNVDYQNGTFQYQKDGKLRICKSYGDYMYNQAKDTLTCTDHTKECKTNPDSTEGCQKVGEVKKSAKEYIEGLKINAVYVEDNTDCWNSGAKVAISFAVAIVAFVALF